MYNFCVVLARCIFGKNDKCLVWNSLIDRILILRRSRSFAAPSLLSLRLGMSTVFTAYASKNADWNQQQLTDGGILANRNSANPPYCFLSNQKKVQILAFFTCDPTKKCIMPSSRERHKGIIGRGHDLRLTRRSHGRYSPRFACLLASFTLARIACLLLICVKTRLRVQPRPQGFSLKKWVTRLLRVVPHSSQG